jgi:outer membrane protein assembly factor BamA
MGMELRELQGGVGDALTPVFIIQAAWDARPGTQLSLSTQRSIYASAILDDQNYTATSLDFTVRQRITDYVDVSLATGYVNTDYSATVTGVDAVREDNYYYIRPAVEWKALSWMSIGIYYEFSRDTSSGGVANGFSRDRGGVEIAILF